MKGTLLSALLLFPGLLLGGDALRKRAVLNIPEPIEYRTGKSYLLTAKIGIRWDEPAELNIKVWRDEKTGRTDRLLGEIEVFDETGNKLNREFFVSIPPMPDGEISLRPGEFREFVFFVWNGSVTFPRPGNYYVIATYRDAFVGKTNVIFTTSKCWFKVGEATSKKSSL